MGLDRIDRRFLIDITHGSLRCENIGNSLPSPDRERRPLCGDSVAWRWPHWEAEALAGATPFAFLRGSS
jgi:hypothetical protein